MKNAAIVLNFLDCHKGSSKINDSQKKKKNWLKNSTKKVLLIFIIINNLVAFSYVLFPPAVCRHFLMIFLIISFWGLFVVIN